MIACRSFDHFFSLAPSKRARRTGQNVILQCELSALRLPPGRAAGTPLLPRPSLNTFCDKPYEDKNKVRVAGPFTAESLSPHRVLGLDENDELIDVATQRRLRREATFPRMIRRTSRLPACNRRARKTKSSSPRSGVGLAQLSLRGGASRPSLTGRVALSIVGETLDCDLNVFTRLFTPPSVLNLRSRVIEASRHINRDSEGKHHGERHSTLATHCRMPIAPRRQNNDVVMSGKAGVGIEPLVLS